MVTIFFEANDSVLEETRGAKFVSLDDFSANLQVVCDTIPFQKSKVVI